MKCKLDFNPGERSPQQLLPAARAFYKSSFVGTAVALLTLVRVRTAAAGVSLSPAKAQRAAERPSPHQLQQAGPLCPSPVGSLTSAGPSLWR